MPETEQKAAPRFVRYSELKAEGILPNRPTAKRWIEREGFPAPYRLAAN